MRSSRASANAAPASSSRRSRPTGAAIPATSPTRTRHHWEVAWNPFWPIRDDGRIAFPRDYDEPPATDPGGRRVRRRRAASHRSGRRAATCRAGSPRRRARRAAHAVAAPRFRGRAALPVMRRTGARPEVGAAARRRRPGPPPPADRSTHEPLEDGGDQRRHVAADDEDALQGRIERAQPGGQAGQRATERNVVLRDRHVRRDVADGPLIRLRRCRWRPGAGARRRDRASGVPRSVRRACRDRSATSDRRRGRSPRARSSCRGDRSPRTGTWPSGVRRRMPRRSRSSRIAITYLRLVPVASRYVAGVSGAVDAMTSACAARSRYVAMA